MENIISKELLSELGYGKVTYIGDVTELYNMECLMFKCDVTRESGRGDDKKITTSKTYYIALEVLAKQCKLKLGKGFSLVEYPLITELYKDRNYIDSFGDLLTELYRPQRVFEACQWVWDNKENK